MVVKILSSGASFSGIKYNEHKVSEGSARLMAMENFGLLDMDSKTHSIHELEQFFTAWSMNERGIINKPQFHVAISCKGKEKDAGELTDIALQYIQKMGYQDNPYLIYFHSDTDNNHVHIVSSRVNEFGLKINDSFERLRSLAVIKKILSQDPVYEIGEQVKQAMAYNFSSEAQFKMLLEGKGVKVAEKEGQYQFIKYGKVNHEISRALVDNKIKAYQEPAERINQLKALFTKYKPALAPDKFSEFMKNKFGAEIIFHTTKGKETPYGYTIIDHAKAQVLKGSQVMKLSDLLTLAPKSDMLKSGTELITALAEDKRLRYRDFKTQLAKLGFELKPAGTVSFSGEEQVSFTIAKERMKEVFYNDRLFEAQRFTIANAAEAEIIRRVMFLKREDMSPLLTRGELDPQQTQNKLIISDKLNSLLDVGKELGDIAKENNYTYAKTGDTVYLVDQKNHAIYNLADLTDRKLDFTGAQVIDTDWISKPANRPNMDLQGSTFGELAGGLMDLLEAGIATEETEEQSRKKKRRME